MMEVGSGPDYEEGFSRGWDAGWANCESRYRLGNLFDSKVIDPGGNENTYNAAFNAGVEFQKRIQKND